MSLSVVVTTYNRPAALARVLDALAAQTEPPDEVVVADDGSGPETASMLSARKGDPFPLLHVWQPDEGFRAALSRNRAVAASRGDWLHFLDGDCVPRPHFVERARRLSKRGWALAGDRILLSPGLTERIEREALPVHRWSVATLTGYRLRGGINRLLPLAYWPWLARRGRRQDDWRLLRTANVGLHRADFEAVNGFDSSFVGWGLEDSEFAIRLINSGVRLRSGRLAIGVLHLWHRESPRTALDRHRSLLEAAIREGRVRAVQGLAETIASGAGSVA